MRVNPAPPPASSGSPEGSGEDDSSLQARLDRAEAALRESEVRFRSALKAGRMGSWETDNVRMTRTWTEEGMALFGFELPGGRGQVGGPDDEYVNALHPEDRHLVQHLRELATTVDSFAAEYRILRPDGSTQWLSGRGLVVSRSADGRPERLVSIMADAAERKRAEEALALERRRLDLALTAGQMGAYDLDIREGTLWWSPQTYAVFGVKPDNFVPTPSTINPLIHPDDRLSFERGRAEAIEAKRPFAHELRIVRPDGLTIWLDLRGQALYDEQGRATRHFGTVMDITERKQTEQRLRDADRQKDVFIATLAHELRNPMASMHNAIELLRRSVPADPGVSANYALLHRQMGQMKLLLDDLLDVGRISQGHLVLRLQPTRLADALEHAIELARPAIDSAHHALSVELPNETLRVSGDPVRLSQVFSNLLINAAKYTPHGGRIALTLARDGTAAVVTVADDGIGIASEDMGRIFAMFGQVRGEDDRAAGGLGIGLSLARGLVEQHGGSIKAHSAGPGHGSQFVVRLPLLGAAVGPQTTASPVAEAPTALWKCRVLVADDIREIADSFALLLSEDGHTVEVAYDGAQALHLAERFRPDVVLMDIGMPDMSGFEVCRLIRRAPWSTGMTLVAQSGWGQDDDRRRSIEAGFDLHFVKPSDVAAVMLAVERIRGTALSSEALGQPR